MLHTIKMVIAILGIGFSLSTYAIETYTEKQLAITVNQQDTQFKIKLKSNPSTGYVWFLRDYNDKLIAPIRHAFEEVPAEEKKIVGAPRYEIWTFRVKPAFFLVPQQSLLRFIYARPFEGNEQAKGLVFKISAM
jgi:inhibitor of cysteine peptidase